MADKRVYGAKLQPKGKGGNLYDSVTEAPMLNVQVGGQNGLRHKIGGFDGIDRVVELHNDTKHQNTQVIAILMQTPKGFDYLPGTTSWAESLRAIIETRAETITGLKGSLTANFSDTDVSGAGEKFSQVVNMLREQSQVEFKFKDIVGRPIQKLLTVWMEYLMMDPDTKIPKISMLSNYETDAWTTEYQTMTVLFIEPDVSHRYIDRAWLGTAMMPRTNGPVEGRRNYMEDAAVLELPIGFTGTFEQGQNVIELATTVFPTLNYLKSDSAHVPLGVSSRASHLNASMMDTGYESHDTDYLKSNP